MEAHGDCFRDIWHLWEVHVKERLRGGSPAERAEVVPRRMKAKFFAAIRTREHKFSASATKALNPIMRSLRGPLTWEGLGEAASILMSFFKKQARFDVVRLRACVSSRQDLCHRLVNWHSEVLSLQTSGSLVQLRHGRGALAPAELLPAEPQAAELLPDPPQMAWLPAAVRPAGARVRGGPPPSGRQGSSGGCPGPANIDPGAIVRLRRSLAKKARGLAARGELDLEAQVHQADSDYLKAHLNFEVYSDFHGGLMNHFNSFDSGRPMGELVPADVLEGFMAVIVQNLPVLLLNGLRDWAGMMGRTIQALQTPMTWLMLFQDIGQWMQILSQQTRMDLKMRGDAKIRRAALHAQLPQAHIDSAATRLAATAFELLPAELLPADPPLADPAAGRPVAGPAQPADPPPAQFLPADLRLARLPPSVKLSSSPAEFPPAGSPPAEVLAWCLVAGVRFDLGFVGLAGRATPELLRTEADFVSRQFAAVAGI